MKDKLTQELQELVDQFKSKNKDIDYDEVYKSWHSNNPMPAVIDLDDYSQAVNKAFWSLKSEAVATFCYSKGVESFRLNLASATWAIEQAILNRTEGTMLSAAIAYVENAAKIYG